MRTPLPPLLCALVLLTCTRSDSDRSPRKGPMERIPAGPAFTLSPGNPTGQDEDPAILLARDRSLYVAWYSDRLGVNDKEIFLVRTTDGMTWTDPPIRVTRHDDWAFYPTLAQDPTGTIHIAPSTVVQVPISSRAPDSPSIRYDRSRPEFSPATNR